MINTNYSTPGKTSFTARFKLTAADGMIKSSEIEILEKMTSKIGKETDSIKVDIGKTDDWFEGDNRDGCHMTGYPMKVITVLDGDIIEKDLGSSVPTGEGLSKPFAKLETFFKKLEQVTNPEFKQEVLSKIETLKTKLGNLIGDKNTIEADYTIKKQAFDKIAAKKESIIAEETSIEKEIEKAQKQLEI